MTKPIISSPADVVGPGAVELVRQRPETFNNINYGRGVYANVLAGFRAQAALALAGISDAATGTNLTLAKGAQLRAYAASEYALPQTDGRAKATGATTLDRTASSNPLLAGVIKKGTRFHREPEPNASVPTQAADYVSTADVPVLFGQTVASVPIVAVRDGSAANTPYFSISPYKSLTVNDALYDSAFKATSYDAGGGSDAYTDKDIVRFARAFAVGKDGPIVDSIRIAALGAGGVRHLLIQDPAADGMIAYVSDPSWGGSQRWRSAVQQSVNDSPFTSYGCKVTVSLIGNTVVNCTLVVRLRDTSYLSDTSDIDASIRKAVRSYFDDRHDFNVYGIQQLRAVVSRVDKRILRCTTASINRLDGSAITYTAPVFDHLYLANNAVSITYQGPV